MLYMTSFDSGRYIEILIILVCYTYTVENRIFFMNSDKPSQYYPLILGAFWSNDFYFWKKWVHFNMYLTFYIGLFVLWCLMPLSTIFQLYRGGQFYWWWNRNTRRKPLTFHNSLTNFITYIISFIYSRVDI